MSQQQKLVRSCNPQKRRYGEVKEADVMIDGRLGAYR